jgi:hypothetical protein
MTSPDVQETNQVLEIDDKAYIAPLAVHYKPVYPLLFAHIWPVTWLVCEMAGHNDIVGFNWKRMRH